MSKSKRRRLNDEETDEEIQQVKEMDQTRCPVSSEHRAMKILGNRRENNERRWEKKGKKSIGP